MMVFTLKSVLKKWKTLILLFAIPLILMGGMAFIAAKAFTDRERLEPFQAAIVDQDRTFQTEYVIKQLTDSEEITAIVKPVITDEKRARTLLKENKIAGMVILPKDFSQTILSGENVPLTVTGNEKKPLQAYLFRQVMESAADYTSAAQSGINTVYDVMSEAGLSPEDRKTEYKRDLLTFSLHALGRNEVFEMTEENSLFLQNVFHYYGVSIFVLLLMVWAYQILLFMRGQLTPGIRTRLLLYRMDGWKIHLAEWAAAVVFLLPLLAGGLYAFKEADIWGGEEIAKTAGGMILLLALFTALFASLSALLRSDRLFQVVSALLISAGSVMGGHFIPAFYLPSWLEAWQAWILNTHVLDAAFSIIAGEQADLGRLSALLIALLVLMCAGAAISQKREGA